MQVKKDMCKYVLLTFVIMHYSQSNLRCLCKKSVFYLFIDICTF